MSLIKDPSFSSCQTRQARINMLSPALWLALPRSPRRSEEADARLIAALERQNALLREQNEAFRRQRARPSLEASLERGSDIEDNQRKWNELDKEAGELNEASKYNKLWLREKSTTHLPEWGEVHCFHMPSVAARSLPLTAALPRMQDSFNPWPDGSEEQSKRPVPRELIPAKVKPRELLDQAWMVRHSRPRPCWLRRAHRYRWHAARSGRKSVARWRTG